MIGEHINNINDADFLFLTRTKKKQGRLWISSVRFIPVTFLEKDKIGTKIKFANGYEIWVSNSEIIKLEKRGDRHEESFKRKEQ